MRRTVFIGLLFAGIACKAQAPQSAVKESGAEGAAAPAPSADAQKAADEIAEMILKVSSKDQVLPTLAKIEEMAKGGSPVARLYAAALSPLHELKGIVTRLRPLGAQSQILQTTIMMGLYRSKYAAYMQGAHIDAVMEFLTASDAEGPKLKTVHEVQDWLVGRIAPRLVTAISEFNKVAQENKSLAFQFDLALGTGSLPSMNPAQRRKLVVADHLPILTAVAEWCLGNIYYFSAYDMDGILGFQNALMVKSAFNQGYSRIIGNLPFPNQSEAARLAKSVVTPIDVRDTYRKTASGGYEKLMTLRTGAPLALAGGDEEQGPAEGEQGPAEAAQGSANGAQGSAEANAPQGSTEPERNGAKLLAMAWPHFKASFEAVDYTYKAMLTMAQGRSAESLDGYIYNPANLLIDQARRNAMMADMRKMAAGAASLTSEGTGQSFQINVQALFNPENKFVRDRKLLFPELDESGSSNGDTVNYNYGKPVRWPDPTFGGFLPDGKENTYDTLRSVGMHPATTCLLGMIPVPTGREPLLPLMPLVPGGCTPF